MATELAGCERAGRLYRFFGWLSLVVAVCMALGIIFSGLAAEKAEVVPVIVGGVIAFVVMAAIGVFYLFLGSALKSHQEWARVVGIILAILCLPGIPIGTIIGIYLLVMLLRHWDEMPAGA